MRITEGMGKILDVYCGNKTGQNILVTGDQVEMIFKSDDETEHRGYYLVFTLVSQASVSHGKWDHKVADKVVYLPLNIPNISKTDEN